MALSLSNLRLEIQIKKKNGILSQDLTINPIS